MLRRALQGYVAHYHLERNHQGLDNELIMPRSGPQRRDGLITRRPRLGGILNYYERFAA
jgi:putative transposase